jgi:exosortase
MDKSAAAAAAPSPHRATHLFAWGVTCLILIVLFLIWPYQHWSFNERSSLISGLVRTVLLNSAMSEWMFCLLVPFIVGYLTYRERALLKTLPYQGSWGHGLAIFLAGLFFYWIGYKADTAYPGYVAAQLVTAGLIVLIGGWKWMRALLFPWLFLIFMWPMIPLEERLAFPLRMQSASLSAKVINLLGVAVVRDGTNIVSAADAVRGLEQGKLFSLEVDAPCSGIRSLFSLLMISALYGWLALRKVWPRWVLFLAAIPLAMLGNIVRMVLLAFGCIWFGPDVAVGTNVDGHQVISAYHEFSGYVVFVVALAGMFALCSLFEQKHWKRGKKKLTAAPVAASVATSLPVKSRAITAAAVTAVALAVFSYFSAQPPIADPGVDMNLPALVNSMPSELFEMTQREREGLLSDVSISRRQYQAEDGAGFMATIVLSGQLRRSLHRPEVCLPGQGWIISKKEEIPLRLTDGREVKATLLNLFRDGQMADGSTQRIRAMNIFYFVGGRGVSTADYYDHVYTSYFDAVFKNYNHRWALVSFFTVLPTTSAGSMDFGAELTGLTRLQDFAGQVAAEIMIKPE